MKILQAISYFNPKFGGDVNVCINLSKEFVKKKHEVTIITTDFHFDSKFANSIQELGVNVIVFHCFAHIGLFLYSPSIKTWLKKNLRKYDIIHLHNYRSYQNNEICSFAIKNRVPYIIQAHGSVLPFFEKQNLKKIYDRIWGYKILKNATNVIALTKIEFEQYQQMGVQKNRIEIIPNGINLSEFSQLPSKGKFRSKYGISEKEKIILFLGRIHKIKGLDLLISAYSELFPDCPDVQLVVVGPDDNYRVVLEGQINKLEIYKKPIFTGPLYGREKLSVYVDSDLYVLPSYYEAFPMTVLEAWACQLPVIVTKNCSISDIIQNGGFVIGSNCLELKEKLLLLLNDEEQRNTLGREGNAIVINEFNINFIIEKIERLYKKSVEVII